MDVIGCALLKSAQPTVEGDTKYGNVPIESAASDLFRCKSFIAQRKVMCSQTVRTVSLSLSWQATSE